METVHDSRPLAIMCLIHSLMEMMHDWTESLDKKNPVDVAYLDYRKAFDSVPHERLLVKLHAYAWNKREITGLD